MASEPAARDDGDMQTAFDGQLNGVAVLDIDRAKRHPFGIHAYRGSRQHTVDVEDNGTNAP